MDLPLNYEDIKETSLSPIAWAVLFSGVLTILFGLWGVLGTRDEFDTTPGKREPKKELIDA